MHEFTQARLNWFESIQDTQLDLETEERSKFESFVNWNVSFIVFYSRKDKKCWKTRIIQKQKWLKTGFECEIVFSTKSPWIRFAFDSKLKRKIKELL